MGARGTLPALSTRRGRGVCWGSRIRLGVGTIILFHGLTSKTNHKLVKTHSAPFWVLGQITGDLDSLDSPRPGLGGSHHPSPYSILCSSAQRLHPNGSFSWDSQGGVPKLSRLGLPGLWAFITSRLKLGLGWGLNQSCSSCRELFNAMSHSCCKRREEVDSQLLVVGSQTTNLTPGPSFAHNLGCRCPNGSCKAILDIYTSRPFQWYKEHSNERRLDPWTRALSFQESRRTPSSHFWECGLHLHTYPKVGLRKIGYLVRNVWICVRHKS